MYLMVDVMASADVLERLTIEHSPLRQYQSIFLTRSWSLTEKINSSPSNLPAASDLCLRHRTQVLRVKSSHTIMV